jgi:hypothetical protein
MSEPHTPRVREVQEKSGPENVLKDEYTFSQNWAVMKMIRSYESDQSSAYIRGFDAGIDLLYAKARFSNPAIAQDIRNLADKMAEETAEALHWMAGEKKAASISLVHYGK